MAIIQSKYAKGQLPIPYPTLAGAVVAHRFAHTFSTAPSLNDILELAPLPANSKVVDLILDADDLDTNGTATISLDVGVMSGDWTSEATDRTCGAEFLDGVTTAQAGGVVRPTLKTAFRVGSSGTDRSIGVKIDAAAATFQAGTIGLTVFYVAAD